MCRGGRRHTECAYYAVPVQRAWHSLFVPQFISVDERRSLTLVPHSSLLKSIEPEEGESYSGTCKTTPVRHNPDPLSHLSDPLSHMRDPLSHMRTLCVHGKWVRG